MNCRNCNLPVAKNDLDCPSCGLTTAKTRADLQRIDPAMTNGLAWALIAVGLLGVVFVFIVIFMPAGLVPGIIQLKTRLLGDKK